jgi:hypothetical protein
MSLIAFHRVLIGAAALFFIGYGLWEGWHYLEDRASLRLVLAAGSLAASAVLLLYLSRLRRFLGLRD